MPSLDEPKECPLERDEEADTFQGGVKGFFLKKKWLKKECYSGGGILATSNATDLLQLPSLHAVESDLTRV